MCVTYPNSRLSDLLLVNGKPVSCEGTGVPAAFSSGRLSYIACEVGGTHSGHAVLSASLLCTWFPGLRQSQDF